MERKNEPESKPQFPKIEEEVLAFWERENVFQRTLEETKGGQPFVFFEGPPTANGKPGIHHVLARAYKDIICRYKTMRGFFVERKAGWDTHGLPVELQVEKELKISGKPDIEKYGVEKFNQQCKESVWKYKKEWEQMTRRIGFWLDLEHPYVTYENEYIESLWWVMKQIWDAGLLYKGHKVVPHCPRCGTALSSHEVAQGYERVTEPSVFVKFKIKTSPLELGDKLPAFVLSWTTTPWTLPGNVALAIGQAIEYVVVEQEKEIYILAKSTLGRLAGKYKVLQELRGSDLIGIVYEPLYVISALQNEKSHRLYAADFVNIEEGTGIVHTAVMYGEDDYQLGEKVGLPKHHTVDENGRFTTDVPQWQGRFVKDKKVERAIITDLEERGLLYKEEMYTHDYPFCWRCDTPLLYYAKDSWFIRMSQLRDQLIKNNEQINWVPGYIKHGRFGEWLNEVKDWAFSRERYWGTPLPIWESSDGDRICVGSFEELRQLATQPEKVGDAFDPHRPYVDDIILQKDGKEYRRVKEVADVWFDSGAMPYAQWHYPFENKERIDAGQSFPAEYISEAIDQTRGWFYTLLAVSTLLGKPAPYRTVVCLNHILDEKGQKMSKSRGNVVDPFEMIEKYGADTLRWHLFTMNQPGDTKLFSEKNLGDVLKKNWLIVWNVYSFWKMYAGDFKPAEGSQPGNVHVLDRWVVARLGQLTKQVTDGLDAYQVTEAGRQIGQFINELSTWYLRRSRARFKSGGADKDQAVATLHYALQTLSQLLAPFVPFFSDHLYRSLGQKTSVHLAAWPAAGESAVESKIITEMEQVRKAVELGHALRKERDLKVRQPLAQFIIQTAAPFDTALIELIREEMNVQEVICVKDIPQGNEFVTKSLGPIRVALDTTITDELKQQGMVRELIRQVNAMRKDAQLTINDVITLYYEIADPEIEGIFLHYKDTICREVIAHGLLKELPDNVDLKKVLEVAGTSVVLGLKKK